MAKAVAIPAGASNFMAEENEIFYPIIQILESIVEESSDVPSFKNPYYWAFCPHGNVSNELISKDANK